MTVSAIDVRMDEVSIQLLEFTYLELTDRLERSDVICCPVAQFRRREREVHCRTTKPIAGFGT